MELYTTIGIVLLAGLIHASFQLGVSMVTLLSGHSIGKQRSLRRVTALAGSFYLGVLTMIMLVVSTLAYIIISFWGNGIPEWLWISATALCIAAGLLVLAAYYRPRSPGTALWLPRTMADFLSKRTKSTRDVAEAYSLGLSSVLAEIIFVLPTSLVAALATVILPSTWQLASLLAYSLVASFGVGIVGIATGSGHRISDIQRWREKNKRFLQYAAGAALILLGIYLCVSFLLSPAIIEGTL